MKKLLALTAVALAVSTAPALADHHEGGEGKGGMFAKHDTNGDGVISKDEFLKQAEERFGKMDANSNGEVSKAEAEAAREKWKEKRKEHMEKRKEMKEKGEAPAEAPAE